MVEGKNTSSESSDSTQDYAIDYNDLLDLFKTNYEESEYDILYDENAKELINNFQRKVPLKKRYFLRLSYELRLIKLKGFFKTFFQVVDILKIVDQDIPTVIRGSAGSSLVCYLLGITSVDPVKFKISLSRFMHEKRDDIPDIDIDFPSHLREKIYEQIYDRYPGRVARISNHLYYKPKSAIREAIRRAGYHKFIPKNFDLTKIFPEKDERFEVRKEALLLEDKFSHYSLHCGGIIIFDEYVPEDLKLDLPEKKLKKDQIKHTQIKLNKDEAEDAGMIKIDILSNRGLSQLSCLSNKKLNEYDWNDMKVWDYLGKGENLGLTHAESPAMKKILRLIKPKNIQELALCLAIIRPGATATGNKGNFMRNFYNNYLPKVDLNNIIIYDDDAIQVIQKLLNCTESQADFYRRGFAKGRKGILIQNEFKKKLNDLSLSYVQKELLLFQLTQLEDFTFCKSHAFSYALLIFALAYHKYKSPKKFWLATLNHANSGYRKWVHFRSAINCGLKIEYGRGNYIMEDNNTLTCDKPEKSTNNMIEDFSLYGWWNQYDFLPGMYVEIDEEIIEENKKKVKKIKFRGLIGIYRPYSNTTQAPNTSTHNLNNNEKSESLSRKLTFVSIGVNNNEFYDCVLWGLHKFHNINIISGNGLYHFNDVSPWIEVKKFKVN
jgi:DNA polymerase III alpha subunit